MLGVELTWKDFRREFNRKFYSSLFRDQKKKEFLDLTQGNKSVAEYEAALMELLSYAAPLVGDKEERCKKFQDGLNPQIEVKIWLFHIHTFF